MELNRAEALRYLGYGGAEPDEAVSRLMEEGWTLLQAAGAPRAISARFPVKHGENSLLSVGPIEVESRDLQAHLSGCDEAWLFAATLGAPVDLLISRLGRTRVSLAVVVQAEAAAWIEDVCNGEEDCLKGKVWTEGLFLRPRFSPGYGDFSIAHQKELVAALDCPRRIGLTVTSGQMLAPAKSVTAVIGIGKTRGACHQKGCASCGKKDCPFRRG